MRRGDVSAVWTRLSAVRTRPALLIGLILAAVSMPVASARAAVPADQEQLTNLVTVAAGDLLSPLTEQIYGVRIEDARFGAVDLHWAAGTLITFPSLAGAADLGSRRDLIYAPKPASGLVIFHQEPGGMWVLEEPPDPGCGAGADLPIPIAVQYDLGLPNCGLAGARLGDPVVLGDSSGRRSSEPRSVFLSYPDGERVRLVDLAPWTRWRANRGADAETYGELESRVCDPRCGAPRRRHLVLVHAHGYRTCAGRLTYRRIEWLGMDAGSAGKRRRFVLPCP